MINARFDSLHRINIKKYQNLSLYVKKCEINKKVWPCEKLVWCLRTNDILIWFWIKKTSLTRRCNSSNCEHNLFSDLLQFYHVRVSFNRVHICTIKVLKEKSLTITKNFCRIELDRSRTRRKAAMSSTWRMIETRQPTKRRGPSNTAFTDFKWQTTFSPERRGTHIWKLHFQIVAVLVRKCNRI